MSINSEEINDGNVAEKLAGMDGYVICPGFGQRGLEGKIAAVKYCRENNLATLGICLGMHVMIIEFARNVLGYADANSSDIDAKTTHPVVDMMEEKKALSVNGDVMRLGGFECVLTPGSKVYAAYGTDKIVERHRHRYEFNDVYTAEFEKAGMMCTGINLETKLVEVMEIPSLDWFIGVEYHPEYTSTVLNPSPLIMNFLGAVVSKMK